nr:xylulose kinase-1 [Tanacetum cinerariifolium]
MATLKFCDTHNMIAYLNKTEGSEGFHQIVDFLNSSHIKFALTENPTIYTSLIQQVWQTVVANTLATGEIQITATIDGNVKLISEASIRRHLKLEDSDSISTLPNTKIFEQLALIGVKDQQSQLSPITHPQVIQQSHNPDIHHLLGYLHRPYDSPLLGGHSPGSDEGSLTLNELTVLCKTLLNKVKKLEKTVKTSQARRRAKIVISDDNMVLEDSSKQGRMIEDIDQYVGVILVTPTKVSSQEDQPEDQLGVLSAAKILVNATRVHTYSRRRRAVSTSSGGVSTASRIISTAEETVSTAGVSMLVSTAGMVQESTYSPRATKDKEEREKYNEDNRTKMLVDLINQRKKFFAQQRAEAKRNKLMTQAQQRTYMSNYIKHMGSYTLKQLKKLSFEEIKELFKATIRRIQDFVPMESEGDKEVSKFARAKGSKRVTKEELDQGSSKKQKIDEASGSVQEQPVELKRLFEPDADDELWKLQRYMHDPLKWRLYDTCGVHHVSTERGHDIFMLVEKDYPLTKGLMTVMLVNKLQVDEFLEMENELLRKIFMLANNPRQ